MLVRAELLGGKPAPKGGRPTGEDVDHSEVRADGLAVLPDGALRVGGSFNGSLEQAVPGGTPLRQQTRGLLDGFVLAMPAPP